VAIFQGSWAVGQLWAFWVAPLIGAALGGLVERWFSTNTKDIVGK
jgi:aquaporin Z